MKKLSFIAQLFIPAIIMLSVMYSLYLGHVYNNEIDIRDFTILQIYFYAPRFLLNELGAGKFISIIILSVALGFIINIRTVKPWYEDG